MKVSRNEEEEGKLKNIFCNKKKDSVKELPLAETKHLFQKRDQYTHIMQHKDQLHMADENHSNTDIHLIVAKLFKHLVFIITTIVFKVSGTDCFVVGTACSSTIATSQATL